MPFNLKIYALLFIILLVGVRSSKHQSAKHQAEKYCWNKRPSFFVLTEDKDVGEVARALYDHMEGCIEEHTSCVTRPHIRGAVCQEKDSSISILDIQGWLSSLQKLMVPDRKKMEEETELLIPPLSQLRDERVPRYLWKTFLDYGGPQIVVFCFAQYYLGNHVDMVTKVQLICLHYLFSWFRTLSQKEVMEYLNPQHFLRLFAMPGVLLLVFGFHFRVDIKAWLSRPVFPFRVLVRNGVGILLGLGVLLTRKYMTEYAMGFMSSIGAFYLRNFLGRVAGLGGMRNIVIT